MFTCCIVWMVDPGFHWFNLNFSPLVHLRSPSNFKTNYRWIWCVHYVTFVLISLSIGYGIKHFPTETCTYTQRHCLQHMDCMQEWMCIGYCRCSCAPTPASTNNCKGSQTVLLQMNNHVCAAVWCFLPAHGAVTSFQIATKKFINSRRLKPSSFGIVINESLWILKILVPWTTTLHLA